MGENGGGVSTIHTRENNVNEVNDLLPCCLHIYDCNLGPNSLFFIPYPRQTDIIKIPFTPTIYYSAAPPGGTV